jgi:hypothetical protein
MENFLFSGESLTLMQVKRFSQNRDLSGLKKPERSLDSGIPARMTCFYTGEFITMNLTIIYSEGSSKLIAIYTNFLIKKLT